MTELPELDAYAIEELNAKLEATIRRIAREEIASLAGLVVRRTQVDPGLDDVLEPPATRVLAEIFGEALNDFTTPTEPGL